MAYLLNNISLSTYGITPVHAPDSNISVQGCFDLPARTGNCYYSWGDSDSVEPYVASSDLFFAGRDIVFSGALFGTRQQCASNLQTFYNAISAASGLSVFETPYNSASGYVKSIIPEMQNGAAKIQMTFREPVVNLAGTLPAVGSSNYTIDSIPFSSFGLYLSKAETLFNLPELKEQNFTKYGSEGYEIVKRQNKTLDFSGFITGNSITDFQNNVAALYKLFSSTGTRNIKINDEINVDCFATEGFKVDNIYLYNNLMIANFKISLMAVSVNAINYLLTANSEYILTANNEYILI